jgi:Protein of unknown function (DUF2631)
VASVPPSEVEKQPVRTPDPHDEPSVDWGWHGTLPRGAQIAGWFVVIALLGMLIGNQVGHVEDIYLVLTAVIMAGILLLSARRHRRSWRR